MNFRLARRSCLLILLASVATAPCARSIDIRTTTIAMSGTPVPGKSAVFDSFGHISNGPAMDGDTIVFVASYVSIPPGVYSLSGVFSYRNGTLNTVADTSTPMPGTNEYFLGFGNDVCIGGSRIYFTGSSATRSGIFMAESGVVSRVVDSEPFYAGPQKWSASGDNVAYVTDAGVFAVISNAAIEVASTNTPVPGGSGTFRFFGTVAIDGGDIVFTASDGNGAIGIYLAQSGNITALVDNSTPIPGSPGLVLEGFANMSFRNGGLAFWGDDNTAHTYSGIYRVYDGILSVVANTTTPLPDRPGNFSGSFLLAFDGGNTAFIGGRPDSSPGLYTFVGDSMVLATDSNLSINGFSPTAFWLNPRGVSGNSIAFGAVMSTATGSAHGVFRADIVPGNAMPVSADYDGDGKSDQAYYDTDTSTWFIRSKDNTKFETHRFGYPSVVPTPGDYDADGIADLAVYDPYYGYWYIMASHDGFAISQFGYYGAMPVPADYDGDGRTDQAVFDPGTGWWFILGSTDGFRTEQFGYYGVRAVPADFDDDGKADIAVYEDARGLWYIHRSGANDLLVQQFGYYGVTPVPSDFDGLGADFAVFDSRDGNWFTLGQVDGFALRQFGYHGVLPVSADYDGDARSDLGVYAPDLALWYLLRTSAGFRYGGL